ncbi:MAG: BamA/TamA family outer membrane protein [Rubrivivax sp.]|nr:BamA/TamA family outer membrane protein [Rubrivivax sp.]
MSHLKRIAALALILSGAAWAQPAPAAPPTFAELEAAGARVGEIRILSREIFDTTDPKEDKLLFRWANKLHIQTRPGVIQRALLFKTGDPVSVRLIDETERVLRDQRFLYDVKFRPVAYHDGVVDIEVETRDTWSLDIGASAGRTGGANTSGTQVKEYNLLGTGISVGFARSNEVDRSSNEFEISNERAFGSRISLGYSHARNSDGRRDAASVVRPFYALDTRWAAGVTASKDDRIDAIYNAGNVVSQYRHRLNQAEVFGGWSQGLVDGWVRRYSLGVSLQEDAFVPEPGRVAPAQLPPDQKLVVPFVRYERIEDRFERELNRNLIGRPEFFALGLASTVQLGWAATGLGSSQNALLYSGSVSRGYEPAAAHTLITSARISGRLTGGEVRRQRLGVQAQYYLPQSRHWLFYASAAGDGLTRPDPSELLMLGGDNGLRGYPLRYQSGERRAQFTVEERFYTDLYVWQLFRIGGAAFFDAGRAWGGPNVNTLNPGWLSNAGFGLRIVSARSAFSNVLHVDLAFPLNAAADMRKVQFLVKTKTSF